MFDRTSMKYAIKQLLRRLGVLRTIGYAGAHGSFEPLAAARGCAGLGALGERAADDRIEQRRSMRESVRAERAPLPGQRDRFAFFRVLEQPASLLGALRGAPVSDDLLVGLEQLRQVVLPVGQH